MRKGVILILGLALVMVCVTSAAAHSRFVVGFGVGAPVVRVQPFFVRPRTFVAPPVVVVPPPTFFFSPPIVARPFPVKRPVWISGRWVLTAWGWQWFPGQWINP